jgi:hypothetical protein
MWPCWKSCAPLDHNMEDLFLRSGLFPDLASVNYASPLCTLYSAVLKHAGCHWKQPGGFASPWFGHVNMYVV